MRTLRPGLGSDTTLIATAVANIIAYIQQNGMTTEQILDRAGAQLEVNEVELLKDRARLQGGGGSGGTGGTGGGQ